MTGTAPSIEKNEGDTMDSTSTRASWLFDSADVQTGAEVIRIAVAKGNAPAWEEALAPVNALLARVKPLDRALYFELDSAVGVAGVALEDAAGLLGFALAKTWPTGPEGLDTWIARAQDFASKSE